MLGVLASAGVILLLVASAGGVRGAVRTPQTRAGSLVLLAIAVPAMVALSAFAVADDATAAALVAGGAAVSMAAAALPRRTGTPHVHDVSTEPTRLDLDVERRAA